MIHVLGPGYHQNIILPHFSCLMLSLQVKAELKMENQRLKDENGALIRVITKLSK